MSKNNDLVDWDKSRYVGVYKELLSVTDPIFASQQFKKKPSETTIARIWGVNRIFVRRVLSNLYPELYEKEKNKDSLPGLSLGKLITIISSIEKNWSGNQINNSDAGKNLYLSREEKIRIINRYNELSLPEMKEIGLKYHRGEILLGELLIKLTDPVGGMSLEDIMSLYTRYISYSRKTVENSESILSDIEGWKNELAEKKVEFLVDNFFQNENIDIKNKISYSSIKKIKAEISRIEYQAGIQQLKHILNNKQLLDYERKYFTHKFIDKISSTIVNNQIINDDYSVHYKYFECERLRPLPLYIKSSEDRSGLLNKQLLLPDENDENLSGLGEQIAYKIRVHFYVILPDDYEQKIRDSNIRDTPQGKRLDFFEEITGVGSPISHIIASLNRVLFWDIPILKEYFYVPRERINCIDIIGGESHNLTWNHTLVELFKIKDIETSISDNVSRYIDCLPSQYPSYGEHCGFDLLEVFLKSSLNARLKAIKRLRIDPDLYMKQLGYRIEELNALRRGKRYLKSYPFSLRAMESTFDGSFLKQYRIRKVSEKNEIYFEDTDPSQAWHLAAYEAHLSLAEAYLKEGLFDISKKYIDHIKFHLRKFGTNIVSDLMHAKYYLCCFRYCYLVDVGDENSPYSDRYLAINDALKNLKKARLCLDRRLRKIHFIGDLSLSNTHPFFYLKSRIYDHEAKLYIYFRKYVSDSEIESWDYILTPIRLLEKSRIYAARDGDADLYSFNTAYQSWCYLMAAFLGERKTTPEGFSKEECIDWSKRLIAHAELCYSPTGRRLWQDLKNNSGKVSIGDENYDLNDSKPTNYISYDRYYDLNIQSIPLIQEISLPDCESESAYVNKQTYSRENNLVTLDMSLLRKINADTTPSLYLFGTNSSIIIFVKGLYEICCETTNAKNLILRISRSKRLFQQSYSIAQDGGHTKDIFKDGQHFLNREFPSKGDTVLKGFYLHRLTQFADLGRVFIVACELIELYISRLDLSNVDFNSKTSHIVESVDKLLEKNYVWEKAKTSNQTYYNAHFKDHYKNLKNYILNEIKFISDNKKIYDQIEVRDRIISDFFTIMSGEKTIEL